MKLPAKNNQRMKNTLKISCILAILMLFSTGCELGARTVEKITGKGIRAEAEKPAMTAEDMLSKNITTFEECVNTGYSVIETRPRLCMTARGDTFEEET